MASITDRQGSRGSVEVGEPIAVVGSWPAPAVPHLAPGPFLPQSDLQVVMCAVRRERIRTGRRCEPPRRRSLQ